MVMQIHMYRYELTASIIGPHNEIIRNILYHLVMLFPLIRDIFNNYMQYNIPVHTAVINCVLLYGIVVHRRLYSVTAMVISE